MLLPSASAALYRRAMLEEIGLFDEDFFLYCEDTDLGLRARWAGWKCIYVPGAVVDHHYSHSAGRASRLKAYYVERNRLFVAAKNFPAGDVMARAVCDCGALLVACPVDGAGPRDGGAVSAGREQRAWVWDCIVLRAHWRFLRHARSLWREAAGDPEQGAKYRPRSSGGCCARTRSARAGWRSYDDAGRSGEAARSSFRRSTKKAPWAAWCERCKSAVPGAPVLVVDDCSRDATVTVARDAGAEVLALPHHLGLGGCVQAGYKLAYELGYRVCDSRGWRRATRRARHPESV